MIYTLGYSGWTPAALTQTVQDLDAVLVDVRLSPRSRVPQWTREAFTRLLGDRYAHVPALGNLNYKTGGPVALADPPRGIQQVQALLAQWPHVILMCACQDDQTCHRLDAAAVLAQALADVVTHLPTPAKRTKARL